MITLFCVCWSRNLPDDHDMHFKRDPRPDQQPTLCSPFNNVCGFSLALYRTWGSLRNGEEIGVSGSTILHALLTLSLLNFHRDLSFNLCDEDEWNCGYMRRRRLDMVGGGGRDILLHVDGFQRLLLKSIDIVRD